MKKLLSFFFFFSSFFLSASEPIKMGVITDIHFLSTELMDNMYAIQNFVQNSGKDVTVVPEILDKVIEDYSNSDIEVLLVCGDLTKDGEEKSHLEVRNKLNKLYEKGVKIFAIPGNHDINMPNALGYQGNKTFETKNVSPKEFESIYANYGYNNAIERDENSLSYVAKLSEDIWLLAIDAARYDDYKDKPITAGRIKTETQQWLENVLTKAQTLNKEVIAMMHWGVVEHLPLQAMFFKGYLVDNYKQIATLLADNEVKVVFTGHFHSNDISEFKSELGNTIYDIETGALVSYPFAYRFADLYKDRIDIRTKNIISLDKNPKLVESNKLLLKTIAQKRALPMLKKQQFDFKEEQLQELSSIAGELFVLHLAGDEIVGDSIKIKLMNVFEQMDFPVDESMNDFSIDLPPKDNNLTIYFK